MSNSALIAELRRKAIETLHESTEMFEQALSELKEGNLEQAEETQELARLIRADSAWLMTEASRLEKEVPSLKFKLHQYLAS
jgi:hypothetical protein